MKLRARTFGVVFALLLIASGALAASYIERRQRGRFVYDLSPSDPSLAAFARKHGYSVDTLEVEAGVRVRGLVRPAQTANDPFVLFFPPNAAQQLVVSLPILELLRAGSSAGMAIWAYRGFEGSDGLPSVPTAAADARAVAEHVRTTFGVTNNRLVLVGYSMGSGIALRLATELAAAGQPPAAVVLLSPFWTLELTPAGTLGELRPSETYVVDDLIERVTFPTLIIAGARDEALPIRRHAAVLRRALGSRAEYWELPEAGHHDYLDDADLLGRAGAYGFSRVKSNLH